MAPISAIVYQVLPLVALLLTFRIRSTQAMQVAKSVSQMQRFSLQLANAGTSCAPLKNMGSHSTVRIGVGTPPQTFNVVADTGSDSVIVTSCICEDSGRCDKQNKCFRGGQNRSSTFKLAVLPPKVVAAAEEEEKEHAAGSLGNNATNGTDDQRLAVVSLTFGSGPIEAILATDYVTVGDVRTLMPDGLLLMIDQALNIAGPFEGILGLGLPRPRGPSAVKKNEDKADDSSAVATGTPETPYQNSTDSHQRSEVSLPMPPGFLEQANVSRFSICFNDGSDGVLRLNVPTNPNALGSIGKVHWGLDFRGISVGDEAPEKAIFCHGKEALKEGQKTACGAIPDSGTTVMMGPAPQVRALYESLCDRWPRCAKLANSSQYANDTDKVGKHELFQVLLYNCSSWLSDKGLNELPDIYFHVAGSAGNLQSLKMTGYGYVMQSKQQEVKAHIKYLMGVFPVIEEVPTGKEIDVCVPAFGTMDFHTQYNGPVWILGTPLFYDFQVVYDLKASPPTMAFDSTPCGSCTEAADRPSLIVETREEQRQTRRVRRLTGPIRKPSFDTSHPF